MFNFTHTRTYRYMHQLIFTGGIHGVMVTTRKNGHGNHIYQPLHSGKIRHKDKF